MDRILNMDEAAAMLGIDPSRARVYCAEGRFVSARKIGKGWAVLESEVQEAVIQRQRPASGFEAHGRHAPVVLPTRWLRTTDGEQIPVPPGWTDEGAYFAHAMKEAVRVGIREGVTAAVKSIKGEKDDG